MAPDLSDPYGATLRIVHRSTATTVGHRVVERMRGAAAKGGPTTDELMELLRGE